MATAVVILHIFGCLCLILVVLLQSGKGASMGAAFGGSSQTVFGGAGAMSFLGKLTTGVAVLFMVTSLLLAIFSSSRMPDSIMNEAAPVSQSVPAVPVAPPSDTPAGSAPAPAGQ